MSDRKAVIKNADMSEDMQQDAVDCATQAMEKYNIEKDIAAYIKKVRQESYGCWLGVGMEIWTGDLGKEVYPMQTKPRSLQSRQITEWFSPKHSP